MLLLLLTLVYLVLTQVFSMTYLNALGIYVIGFGIVKGFFSEELKDVFNLRKTKYLYEVNGRKDSLVELVCLTIMYINAYFIDYEPFTLFEFVVFFFLIAFTYRFIFWGVSRAIRESRAIKKNPHR